MGHTDLATETWKLNFTNMELCAFAVCTFLLVAYASGKGVDTYCPPQPKRDGNLHVNGHTCYQIVLDHITDYPSAKGRCESQGGSLALVKDQATSDFLVTLLQTDHPLKRRFWIGLSDTVTEHDYTWEDGTKLSDGKFDNWAKHEGPLGSISHYIEDCVAMDMMDSGYWHDYECDDKADPFDLSPTEFPYICQYTMDSKVKVTVTSSPDASSATSTAVVIGR